MAAVTRVRLSVAAAIGLALVLATLTYLIGRQTGAPHAATRPGPVDVGFSQDMAAHHDQAVVMANMAITRGGPAVRGIADTILTDQSQEIGQLRGWLQLWDEPIADPHPMSWMPVEAMAGHEMGDASMPGMASPGELATLYSRSGKQFDVWFLQLMIRHHQGGVLMAHYAETHARLAGVRSAATAMRVEQAQDLSLMLPLLQADGGKELPAP